MVSAVSEENELAMQSITPRTYHRAESVVFRKTNEKFGGLSNMAPGFPLRVSGFRIRTSEALYQACRFPHMPEVQRIILRESSPMTAKMRSKPFRKYSREDWDDVRVPIMRWCLRVKLACNWEEFSQLLKETDDRAIVEESRKDAFWGAKPLEEGALEGCNVLGRLLMELRHTVRWSPSKLRQVLPPNVSDFVLLGEPLAIVEAQSPACSDAAPSPVQRAFL